MFRRIVCQYSVQLEEDAGLPVLEAVVVGLGALALHHALDVDLADLAWSGPSAEVALHDVGLLRVGFCGAQKSSVV